MIETKVRRVSNSETLTIIVFTFSPILHMFSILFRLWKKLHTIKNIFCENQKYN